MARVEVLDETRRFPRTDDLRRVTEGFLVDAGLVDRELTLVLLDDAAMAARNLADRGVEGPTDVLSYPTFEPEGAWFPEVPQLGDVLVSIDTAERQAREHGHSTLAEVLVLTAHGVTHLTGLDHTDAAAWRPFHAAQERILALARAAGVAP